MADKLNITRRDFVNGVALSLAAGTSLSPLEILAAAEANDSYYPPALTGLRGSHVGSFEIAHAVGRAGAKFERPKRQTDANYDLVVVGGGISGLAAAKLFRDRKGRDAKILVLDNHDDFGGHAKRNEFDVDGHKLIAYGGSQSLEAPALYSRQSKEMLASLGIEPQRFYKYFDQEYFGRYGLKPGIHFSKDRYGKDLTLPNVWRDWVWEQEPAEIERIVASYPISAASKRSILELLYGETDYLTGRSHEKKVDLLRSTSYSDFLHQYAGATMEVVDLVRDSIKSYWGFGWDMLSALEAYRLEMPGTYALGIRSAKQESWSEDAEPYIFHFPDGNASIARALVRDLLPGAVPGSTMEDLVTSPLDYALLDRLSDNARIRLNSTAIDVRHSEDESQVEVTYVRDGKTERVCSSHSVLACYNSVIPHICPEVSDEQRTAIEFATKVPLAYINVAIRNWQVFSQLGFSRFYVPQANLVHEISLDYPVSMGNYEYSAGPDQPAVLHCVFSPTRPQPGLSLREALKAGRRRMLEMSFDDYETQIVAQLNDALSGAGFDAARDIAAITVNRWPHGYAYEYIDLYDPPEFDTDNGPHIAARAQIGRISIANSDSSASAYVDGAIDAAYRAVEEQLL